jgi:biotin carboxyl carrier protein
MANYRVTIKNRTYDVSIENDQLVVNGDLISYDMDSLNDSGLHILRQPNKNTEAYLEPNREGQYEIQIEGNHLHAEVLTGSQSSRKTRIVSTGDIHSPMPGLIVDIMVKIGDKVKEGQTLLIQEAMKMQMKLRAPSAGVVKFISTSPGSQVEKGVLLVSLSNAG